MPALLEKMVAPLDRERGQERLGFRTAEFDRVTLAMKKYVASNPEHVGVLGSRRIVQRAKTITDLVEQLPGPGGGLMRLHMDNVLVVRNREVIQRLPALWHPTYVADVPRYPAAMRSNATWVPQRHRRNLEQR